MFTNIFLNLMLKDWRTKYTKFNECIRACNDLNLKALNESTNCEYITYFALFIGAVVFSAIGVGLQDIKGGSKQRDMYWSYIVQSPGYNDRRRLYRFKKFRMTIAKIYEQNDLADTNPWWRFKGAIDEFNSIQKVQNNFVLLLFYIKL